MATAPASAPYYVEGKTVVGEGPIILPDLCVQCGREVYDGKRTEKKFYWAPPLLFVLILVNLIVLLIVYMIVRKPVWLGYSQCRECRGRKVAWLWAAGGAWLGTIGLVVAAISYEMAEPAFAAIPVLIAAIVFGFLGRAPVQIKNFKKPNFVLTGFVPEYLERLEDAGEGVMLDRECLACGEALRSDDRECPVCGEAVERFRAPRRRRAFD